MTSHIIDDGASTILERFSLLALSEGLKKKSKQYKDRRREFIIGAVTTGFGAVFGGNISSLPAWKDLCRAVGVEGADAFTSITQCRDSLRGRFVNIVDLVDAGSAGAVMKSGVFTSSKALGNSSSRSTNERDTF
ncbi:hypothetical protein LshimejAT787_1102530 [Lyophyllum shimeji]|uniref:Uncharacterized protein n=1 Tax=Lyophyllum shimeji TaxID=47721 RepID=A0A9P3PUG9_LYOSH|nr:hypothetical protein LshimejAT787_1102530 [Lyophyllum shimeji]